MAIALTLFATSVLSLFVFVLLKVPELVNLPQKREEEKIFFVEKEKIAFLKRKAKFCFSLRNVLGKLLFFLFSVSRKVEKTTAKWLYDLKNKKKD